MKAIPLTEKRGLIPPEPDVPLTLISLIEKRCLISTGTSALLALNLVDFDNISILAPPGKLVRASFDGGTPWLPIKESIGYSKYKV